MNKRFLCAALLSATWLAGCQTVQSPEPGAVPSQSTSVSDPEPEVAADAPSADSTAADPTEADTAAVSEDAELTAQGLKAWPVVSRGAKGEDVRTVQYLLNAHGAKLDVDGDFGGGTEDAVKKFQRDQGLTADGDVGPNTWSKLIVTVKKGSTGNAVRAVQDYLNIAVDGDFGNGTDAAVRSFQGSHGLTKDGVVGPDTWRALVAGTTSGGGGTAPTTDRAKLAKQILSNRNITLSHSSDTRGGSPYQTILDTSRGLKATSGCHGNANCGAKVYLNPKMLAGMLAVAAKYKFVVSSTTGSGQHVATSYHYRGNAFDVSSVNGRPISNATDDGIRARCRAVGAREVLGPGDAGHDTHVHCGNF